MRLKATAAILLRLRLREKRIVAIDFIVGMVYFHARSVGHVSSFSIRVRLCSDTAWRVPQFAAIGRIKTVRTLRFANGTESRKVFAVRMVRAFDLPGWGSRGRRFKSCRPDWLIALRNKGQLDLPTFGSAQG